MYCLQWLLPLLLIPRPANLFLLHNHSMFMTLYLASFFLERRPCTICTIVFIVAVILICYSGIGNCLFLLECSTQQELKYFVIRLRVCYLQLVTCKRKLDHKIDHPRFFAVMFFYADFIGDKTAGICHFTVEVILILPCGDECFESSIVLAWPVVVSYVHSLTNRNILIGFRTFQEQCCGLEEGKYSRLFKDQTLVY